MAEVRVMSWEQKQIFEFKLAELENTRRPSPAYTALLFLMLHTGLRPGEAQTLKLGDIDFQENRLRVERSAFRATLRRAIKSTKTGRASMG